MEQDVRRAQRQAGRLSATTSIRRAQHLLTLINDILDLSKIEAGRMELGSRRASTSLGCSSNALTLVRERAGRHGLTPRSSKWPDAIGEWVADERKVKQVVINLLSNAVKFTPAGGSVTLRARRCRRRMAHGRRVEIAVIDTGVGIAADQQALVFEEFRQASGVTTLRKSEGTGPRLRLPSASQSCTAGRFASIAFPVKVPTFAFVRRSAPWRYPGSTMLIAEDNRKT